MTRESSRQFGGLIAMAFLALGIAQWVLGQGADNAERDDSALREYRSANGLLQRGMFDLAAAEYQKFLAAHPDHEKNPVARYGLGVCLYRTQKYDQAIETLTSVLQINGFEFAAESLLIVGQSHFAQKRFDKAASNFDGLVKKHTQHELADDAAAMLAESQFRNGNFDQSRAAADEFVKRWPENPLRERAEFFGAQAAAAKADFADAGDRAAALLKRFPLGQFASRAAIVLAQSRHRAGKLDDAEKQYRAIIDAKSSEFEADALGGLGTLLQERGKNDQAAACFDRLIEGYPQHPSMPAAQMARARLWFDDGQYDKAFTQFEKAAANLKDREDEAAYWLAKCELRQNKFQDAAQRLGKAIEKHSSSELLPEMTYDRAVALLRLDHKDAPAALQSFRQQFPNHPLAGEALYLAAMNEHQRQNYDRSAELCDEFLKRHPSHVQSPSAVFLAAENQYLASHWEQAVHAFQDLFARHPAHPQADQARFRLGSALYRLNRLDEARDALATVAENAQKDKTLQPALLLLGDVEFQTQNWAKAEQSLRDYVTLKGAVDSRDDAVLKLALAQARQNKHAEAVSTFDQLLSQLSESPHRVQAEFERGQSLAALNQPDQAAAAFERVVQADLQSRFAPYALNHLATMAMQRKQYKDAADLFNRAAKSGAGTALEPEALYQQGQALLAVEDFDAAHKAFTNLIDDFESHERTAAASARRAIALCRLKQHDAALDEIERTLRDFSPKLEPELKGSLLYEKAWCLRELKMEEQARQAYRALLDLDADPSLRAHATLELAELESGAGNREQAAALLKTLCEAQSASAPVPANVREQAQYRLAVNEFESGRFDQSAAMFEGFLRAFPNSALTTSAQLYCGESLFKTNKFTKAAAHLTAVADKQDDQSCAPTALLRLGECQAQLQNWEASEKSFARYLEQNAGAEMWYQAQFGVGWARENRNQYPQAIAAYQQVTRKHQGPTAARAQFQIGECYFALKQHDNALRELLNVDILFAYPEWSAAALYEAGRCLEAMNKPAQARTQFEAVKEKHPDSKWAGMAAQRLAASEVAVEAPSSSGSPPGSQ